MGPRSLSDEYESRSSRHADGWVMKWDKKSSSSLMEAETLTKEWSQSQSGYQSGSNEEQPPLKQSEEPRMSNGRQALGEWEAPPKQKKDKERQSEESIQPESEAFPKKKKDEERQSEAPLWLDVGNYPSAYSSFTADTTPITSMCAECGKRIEGATVTASNKEFHPECFKCIKCEQTINSSFQILPDGERVCDKCSNDETCTGCHNVLEGQYTTALEGKYHLDCFKCTSCSKTLDGSFFQNESGDIVCASCTEN